MSSFRYSKFSNLLQPFNVNVNIFYSKTQLSVPVNICSFTINSHFVTQQNRTFTATSLRDWWGIPRYRYTKYRIAKPWSETTQFEDIFMSNPSKDDLAKFTKDMPLFLRFLKLVTDLEGRSKSFSDYAKRCTQGLIVEKDVYITKKELIDIIWKNGYSESEMNAFEIAFPSDYKFHYPELAVLFDISEEDCYKFCLRQRAQNPTELVELNYTPPENLVSTYGIVFIFMWLGFSNNVLGNAWFLSKTIPFGLVFWLLGTYFYKEMKNYIWKEEASLLDTARQNKALGEESIYKQMKTYSNDAKCLEFLMSFKDDVQNQLAMYHSALANKQKILMTTKLNQKLNAIRQTENTMKSAIQQTIVTKLVDSFKEKFSADTNLQSATFESTLAMISKDYSSSTKDPLIEYFRSLLQDIQNFDFSNPKNTSNNPIILQIAEEFKLKEQELLDTFTVKPEEAKEVQKLVSKCTTNGIDFDFSKLTNEETQKLERLYQSINNKVGYEIPHEDQFTQLQTPDDSSKEFIQYVNSEVKKITQIIKQNRLNTFAQSFI